MAFFLVLQLAPEVESLVDPIQKLDGALADN
jgi:hypothetical protein